MPVKRLKRHEIDTQKWDQTIRGAFRPMVYAYSWFLDVVSPNWQALVYNDYEVIMPLPITRKWGINRLLQPPFTQQLGVFAAKELSEEALHKLLNYLPKYILKTDLQFHNAAPIQGAILRNNYLLPLNKSYETLSGNYNQNTKRNLKRAAENSFEIHQNGDPNIILETFKTTKGNKLTLKQNFYETFSALFNTAKAHISVTCYHAYLYGDFAAGIVVFLSQNRAYYLLSATSPVGKSTSAMPYLIDWFIRQHAGSPIILDFEGSDHPNLAQFYSGFGAQLHPYQRLVKGFL